MKLLKCPVTKKTWGWH